MPSRYDNRLIFNNRNSLYGPLRQSRSVRFFRQYTTPELKKLTRWKRGQLTVQQHVWGMGDRLYKLAATHYGDGTYWWVIARFNNKPTEAHFKPGDIVSIPLPREAIVKFFRD